MNGYKPQGGRFAGGRVGGCACGTDHGWQIKFVAGGFKIELESFKFNFASKTN